MTTILIKNIKELLVAPDKTMLRGAELSQLEVIDNAFVYIERGIISDFGLISTMKPQYEDSERIIDAIGSIVMPAFCDSHSHIVYCGSREGEFTDKIGGLSYEEIARRGGGILNSADRVRECSEEELYRQSLERALEVVGYGTGALEIKSGYGLDLKSEMKMLRVARRIGQQTPLTVRTTLLGAHAVAREYIGRQQEYVDMICTQMIPTAAHEGLADYVDVFCDKGFFTIDQTEQILECAAKFSLPPKIHANELALSGGIEAGVKHGAVSVDHLEFTEQAQINLLANSNTIATLLPGAAFFLGMKNPPARAMIEGGVALALASDYNPGSSPSGNMKFILSLASIILKMTPAEAINAATVNGACAMGLERTHGRIAKGMKAKLIITTPIPSYTFLPYAYTTNLIREVLL